MIEIVLLVAAFVVLIAVVYGSVRLAEIIEHRIRRVISNE